MKLRKDVDFLGRNALEAKSDQPPTKRLACFTVDDPQIVLLGRETIMRDGEPVGYLTSGGFGYTVGRNIGYGYVRHAAGVTDDFLTAGAYELVVATNSVPATLHLEALYDPTNARIKA